MTPPLVRVVGLDPSYTATGVASAAGCATIRFPKLAGMERLAAIRDEVGQHVAGATLVVIEGYSMGSKFGREAAGELGGMLRLLCWDAGLPVLNVAPKSLKLFATSSGNAGKDQMVLSAARLGAPVEKNDNDQADAWWLRQVGLYLLKQPGVPVTAYRAKVTGKLAVA